MDVFKSILVLLVLSSSVQAQSPAAVWAWSQTPTEVQQPSPVWKVEFDGFKYDVTGVSNIDEAIEAAKQKHRAKQPATTSAPKSADIRDFRGVVLTVGPDNNTGTVTASTRGAPVPIVAVYHNGQAATHWAPVEVRQLPTTQRVTPAEQFTRTVPSSTTMNATGKPVCVT